MTTITLLSWNINGARAAHRTGFLPWLAEAAPDILCLQETRCDAEQLPAEMRQPSGYHAFWHGSARKKGYSGTALLTRSAPEAVRFGLGDPQFDDEGRTIVADYRRFHADQLLLPQRRPRPQPRPVQTRPSTTRSWRSASGCAPRGGR